MTVTTVYPHADGAGGATTTDGSTEHQVGDGTSWTTLVNGAGTTPGAATDDDAVKFSLGGWDEDNETNKWRKLLRGIALFSDPAIDVGDTITSAVLSAYGQLAGTGAGDDTINIYSSNPATATAIVAGDFDSLGSTAFADSGILISNISTSGFNDWTLNASGLANINKNAISKFGFRNDRDVADSAPSWVGGTAASNIRVWSADEDQSGDRRPKLAITHSLPFTPKVIIV